MQQYLELLEKVLKEGKDKPTRTGVDSLSILAPQLRFNMPNEDSIPIITTKKIHLKSIFVELLWFLRGDTNTKMLKDHGVTIWDEWADEKGDLGPVYGSQWRNWSGKPDKTGIDQIKRVLEDIKKDPHSRRHIVSAWNVEDIPNMALAPCHCLFQFYAEGDEHLSLHLYQRSADLFLGVPFNITSYALLLHMFCHVLKDRKPKELVITFGDLHLYKNHIEQAKLQLSREPKEQNHKLLLNPDVQDLFQFDYDDIKVEDYQHYDRIPAPIAV